MPRSVMVSDDGCGCQLKCLVSACGCQLWPCQNSACVPGSAICQNYCVLVLDLETDYVLYPATTHTWTDRQAGQIPNMV